MDSRQHPGARRISETDAHSSFPGSQKNDIIGLNRFGLKGDNSTMSGKIHFTSHYNDLSTNKGFQFEFLCDRCGAGHRTRFAPSVTGSVSTIMDTASSLFGGVFSRAADLSNHANSAAWEKAHDDAFEKSINELTESFVQCPRCQSWVCRQKCWNQSKGLCKNCAPELGVEMAAAQASHSVQEVWAHARMADEDKHLDAAAWKDVIRASCPKCGAAQEKNAKFCPECGEKMAQSRFCGECGAKQNMTAKFCNACGHQL